MAKIKEEDIDALRERADIVDVVSGYTRLKKAGGHTLKGLCPFHSEKTPSFTVDSARGLFHCFGCQEGGNVYQFVQKVENLPFPEAVEWLARRVGFDLRYEEMRPGEKQASGIRARIIKANGEASAFWHKTLMESPDALQARRYLEGRGFDRPTAERWQLGYAPGRNSLSKHLLAKGFTQQEIEQGDLGRRSERDGSLYDSFRQRITFPTWNLQGDVVGFGARAMGDAQPKYLNTSETPVFSKSRVMYGLNRAKSAIARGSAVVVEGYTDVIALHEAGVEEAVATNGVALGDTHFELLKKFSQRVVLMLDSDTAGRGATERSFGVHHRIGLEVLVAPLPPGRDPADVVAEDGVDGISKAIESARPLLEFVLEETLAKLPTDTPEARSRAVREAARVLGWHPDPIARGEYAFMAARRIGVDVGVLQRAQVEEPTAPGGSDRAVERRLPGHVKVEREALQLLLTEEAGIAPWLERISEQDFTSPPRRELFREAVGSLRPDSGFSGAEIASRLSPDALSLFTELAVGEREVYPEEPGERAKEIFVRLKVFTLERNIKTRRDVLQDVNPLDDPRRHDELFTELVGLEAERRDLLSQLQGAA
ncbi:MAG: DNA primase [Actinomycetota bacterium]|nr:DNA primase [Actinomycetota bacterium]